MKIQCKLFNWLLVTAYGDQVGAHGAADAAVHHLDDLLVDVLLDARRCGRLHEAALLVVDGTVRVQSSIAQLTAGVRAQQLFVDADLKTRVKLAPRWVS